MVDDLHERLATFGLTLHEAKTRLIEFGKGVCQGSFKIPHLLEF